jgi:hypothetical protein
MQEQGHEQGQAPLLLLALCFYARFLIFLYICLLNQNHPIMKFMKLSAFALLAMGFIACGGSEATTGENTTTTNEPEVEEVVVDGEFRTIDMNTFFNLDIPSNMTIMPELNEGASLAYGYVAEVGAEVKEHYVIVIMETMEEIESYDLGMDFDALSYSEIALESLTASLSSYEILNGEPKVTQVNGLDCVITEMNGKLGEVGVFYKLGVFEGENAFYQVLTWTIDSQRAEFQASMDKIINSFKEKSAEQ